MDDRVSVKKYGMVAQPEKDIRETVDTSMNVPIFETFDRYPNVSPTALPLEIELRVYSASLTFKLN